MDTHPSRECDCKERIISPTMYLVDKYYIVVNSIVRGVEGHYTQKYTKIGGIGEHHLFGTRVPIFATTESLESFEKKMRDSHLEAIFNAKLTPVGEELYKE